MAGVEALGLIEKYMAITPESEGGGQGAWFSGSEVWAAEFWDKQDLLFSNSPLVLPPTPEPGVFPYLLTVSGRCPV